MRKIEKSQGVPATLVGAPVPTSANKVDKNIYGAADVRYQLEIDQHYKCAYCECYLPLKFHDVEHFRPKSHYYWLGHEWNNLLYSCERCNRNFLGTIRVHLVKRKLLVSNIVALFIPIANILL